jgi:hypothetical protein
MPSQVDQKARPRQRTGAPFDRVKLVREAPEPQRTGADKSPR